MYAHVSQLMILHITHKQNVVLVILLALVIVLTPIQLYTLPSFGHYLPAALIFGLLLCAYVLVLALRGIKLPSTYFLLLALILGVLMVLQLTSLLWSKDISTGLRTLTYELVFISVVACAYFLAIGSSNFRASNYIEFVCIALLVAGFLSLLCYLLVVLQFSYPNLRDESLSSSWISIVINPNTVDDLREKHLNFNSYILPGKAGGFFPNPNVSSGYFGIVSIALWWVAVRTTFLAVRRLSLVLAFIFICGVYFTGSKFGLLLAVFLPLIGVGFRISKRMCTGKVNSLSAYIFVLLIFIGFLCALPTLQHWHVDKFQEFFAELLHSLNVRISIWLVYIRDIIETNLFLGQGFGDTSYYTPPHNTLIYLWSQSGMFAMLLGALFMISVLWLAGRLFMMPDKDSEDTGLALGLIASWLFIHGMGTNWGLIGEEHQYVIFALMLGIACAQYDKVKQDPKTQVQARVASGS